MAGGLGFNMLEYGGGDAWTCLKDRDMAWPTGLSLFSKL